MYNILNECKEKCYTLYSVWLFDHILYEFENGDTTSKSKFKQIIVELCICICVLKVLGLKYIRGNWGIYDFLQIVVIIYLY